jgi:hypothetical protein
LKLCCDWWRHKEPVRCVGLLRVGSGINKQGSGLRVLPVPGALAVNSALACLLPPALTSYPSFDSETLNYIFFQNVSELLPDYMVSHRRLLVLFALISTVCDLLWDAGSDSLTPVLVCLHRAAWWHYWVARGCMPGTAVPTSPQHVSVEVPAEVLEALWAARTQHSVSPCDFWRSFSRVQSADYSWSRRTRQTDWRFSAADGQVNPGVEPHIARGVSTDVLVWSTVVGGNSTKTNVAALPTDSLWRHQSQQSFNTLTPFYFPFSLTTCFGPYGPSSGEIYN